MRFTNIVRSNRDLYFKAMIRHMATICLHVTWAIANLFSFFIAISLQVLLVYLLCRFWLTKFPDFSFLK